MRRLLVTVLPVQPVVAAVIRVPGAVSHPERLPPSGSGTGTPRRAATPRTGTDGDTAGRPWIRRGRAQTECPHVHPRVRAGRGRHRPSGVRLGAGAVPAYRSAGADGGAWPSPGHTRCTASRTFRQRIPTPRVAISATARPAPGLGGRRRGSQPCHEYKLIATGSAKSVKYACEHADPAGDPVDATVALAWPGSDLQAGGQQCDRSENDMPDQDG